MLPRVTARTTKTKVDTASFLTSAEAPLCAVCRKNKAAYTCPACNLRYCSSTCYRDPAHDACSESFYRKSLLEDIESAPGRTPQERTAMLDILQRLESSNLAEGSDEEVDEQDAERLELEARLNGADISVLTAQDLEQLLSPAQKAELEAILKDPQKAAALLDLGDSNDLHREPWWCTDVEGDELDMPDDLPAAPPTAPLAHNVLAVLLAYASVVRAFGVESCGQAGEERLALTRSIRQITPFIFEQSQTNLTSIDEAIAFVLSRMKPDPAAAERAIIFGDVATLLKPRRIASGVELVPYSAALRGLLDIGSITSGAAKRKILFYAGWLRKASSATYTDAERRLRELAANELEAAEALPAETIHEPAKPPVAAKPLIEEIG